jgi:cellulose synthase (UDP-forming)
VAYCWHDRVEGSSTWYGITDYKGRKKPVYYAIREKWTGNKSHPDFPDIAIEFGAEKLEPGNYYPFKATQLNVNETPVKYEWSLQSADGTEHFPGFIRLLGKQDHITMKVPTVNGTYRLYLYASDKKGNVTTVSYPIVVSKEHQHTKNENTK